MKKLALAFITVLTILSCSKDSEQEEIIINQGFPTEKPKTGIAFRSDLISGSINVDISRQGVKLCNCGQALERGYILLEEGAYTISQLRQGEVFLNRVVIDGSAKTLDGRVAVVRVRQNELTEILILN